MPPNPLGDWLPVLLLAALVVLALAEWFKFKLKQQELGASTHELERRLAEVKADFEEREEKLQSRIQNLEAIVTTQAQDLLEEGATERGTRRRTTGALKGAGSGSPGTDDAEQLAGLARRLRD